MNNAYRFFPHRKINFHICKPCKFLSIAIASLLVLCIPMQALFAEPAAFAQHTAPVRIHIDASPQSKSLLADFQAVSDVSIYICCDSECHAFAHEADEFDLYLCSSKDTDFEMLIASASIAPIEDQALIDNVKEMIPGLADYVMHNDVLYALPISLDTSNNRVYFPDLFKKFNLGSVPYTIEEYINLTYNWYSSSEYPKRVMAYKLDSCDVLSQSQHDLLEKMLIAYVHSFCHDKTASALISCNFDTPSFRTMLEKYKSFAAFELTDRAREAERIVINNLTDPEYLARGDIKRQVFAQPYSSPFYEYEQHVLFDPAWDRESEPAVHTNINFFLLSANSENKEAALRFLNAYADRMDPSYIMQLHPDQSFNFNQDMIAAYREIADHYCFGACTRYIRALLAQADAPTLIMDYCTGTSQLTEDQVIHALNSSLSEAINNCP